MKITEIQAAAKAILADVPALAAVPILSQLDADYNARFNEAKRSPGLFIILAQMGGSLGAATRGKPVIVMDNELLVIVCENEQSNALGISGLSVVERVLESLHFATYTAGGRGTFAIGEPAYERGPVGDGCISWLCPFRIQSTNTINAS